LGNISYQITGLKPFTDNKFATIGNDWAVTNKILNTKQIKQYQTIATAVGKRLAQAGWKGLFGIDVIVDGATGRLYLLEINARQPASATFESELQQKEKGIKNKEQNDDKILLTPYSLLLTTFEAHLGALLGLDVNSYEPINIVDGAQVILRKSYKVKSFKVIKSHLKNVLKFIEYPNSKEGADWLRIQSAIGIMAGHGRFNSTGRNIVALISNF
jgi:hypothetical protein